MKIIFAIGTMGNGGAERTVANLANYLVEKGHSIIILVLDGNESFYELNNSIVYKKLDLYKKDISTIKLYKTSIIKIRKLLKEHKVDIVLCMNYKILLMLILANIFINTPIVGSERSNPYIYPKSLIWRKLRWITIGLADGYIFQSNKAKKYFTTSIQKKSVVISNPINNYCMEYFQRYEGDKMQIVSMGRLELVKGFDILIKAFSNIADEISDINLIIYGEGSERKNLEKIIEELNINDRVYLPGASLEVIEKISDSKCFVLSSRAEGMPNSLIEAMAIGIPCIATKCKFGPEELINNEVNGLLVEVDNVEEMTEAIKKVVSDKKLMKKLSKNALKIRESNSIEKISMEYYKYFEEVIQRSK